MCLSRKVVDQTCRVCHVLQWPCEQKNSLGPTSFFPEMFSNHLAMLWNMSAIHMHFSNNLSKKVLKFSSQISTIYSMHTVTSKLPPFLLPSLPLSLTLTTAPIDHEVAIHMCITCLKKSIGQYMYEQLLNYINRVTGWRGPLKCGQEVITTWAAWFVQRQVKHIHTSH